MGLVISVGALADELASDDDGRDERVAGVRADFAAISRALAAAKVGDHHEPETLPRIDGLPIWELSCESFPYRTLHILRRFQAHVLAGHEDLASLRGVSLDDEVAGDPLVREEYERGRSHLICHSDGAGYYVPVRFAKPIRNEKVPGGEVGSSFSLRDELLRLAGPLGLPLVAEDVPAEFEALIRKPEASWPWQVERVAWLALYRNVQLSIAHATAIRFS